MPVIKSNSPGFIIAERPHDKAAREGMPRVDRDPCSYCGVRGDIGCTHRKVYDYDGRGIAGRDHITAAEHR